MIRQRNDVKKKPELGLCAGYTYNEFNFFEYFMLPWYDIPHMIP
jgi:hypothetical protein